QYDVKIVSFVVYDHRSLEAWVRIISCRDYIARFNTWCRPGHCFEQVALPERQAELPIAKRSSVMNAEVDATPLQLLRVDEEGPLNSREASDWIAFSRLAKHVVDRRQVSAKTEYVC